MVGETVDSASESTVDLIEKMRGNHQKIQRRGSALQVLAPVRGVREVSEGKGDLIRRLRRGVKIRPSRTKMLFWGGPSF